MKTKSVKKNYIYNVIYQILLIILPLITTPYISRTLTSNGVGQYSFSLSLVTYFTIFASLGFNIYGQREIAKYQDDKLTQSKIFFEIFICRLLSVGLSLIVHLSLIFSGVYGENTLLMKLLTINIIAIAFNVAFYFEGNEDFGKLVGRNLFIKIIGTILIFVLVKDSSDVWIYTLLNSIVLIVSNLIMWPTVFKILKKINFKELKPLRHLKSTIKLFIPTIAISLYTVLDKSLIGFITKSNAQNGYYEEAEKIVKTALTLITCLATVMVSRNTDEVKNGKIKKAKENNYKAMHFVWLIGLPLMVGIFVIADSLVPWFLGAGYDKSITLLKIFSVLIIAIGVSNVLGYQFLLPFKHDNKYTIAITSGAVINCVLNIPFIYWWGANGAAIATIIAELLIATIMLLMVKKELSLKQIFKSIIKPLVASLLMGIIIYPLSMLLDKTIISTLILICVGVVVYGVTILLLKDKLVLGLLNTIKQIFVKKEKINEENDMRSEELLSKLHKTELDILIEFDKVCKKLNLRYTLSSGTLIGAVRHKGFIPWDDDIDVAMPREDYEVFMQKAKDLFPEHLYLEHYYHDKNNVWYFAKLKNSNTTWIPEELEDDLSINQGVGIDIFPIDKLDIKDHKKIKRKNTFYNRLRTFYTKKNVYSTKLKAMIGKIIYKPIAKIWGRNKINKKQDELMKSSNGEYTYADMLSLDVIMPYKYFEEYTTLTFEGYEFSVIKEWDKYLTASYGNYMELPPEEKRQIHLLKHLRCDIGYKEYLEQINKNKR